eukprot:535970_1
MEVYRSKKVLWSSWYSLYEEKKTVMNELTIRAKHFIMRLLNDSEQLEAFVEDLSKLSLHTRLALIGGFLMLILLIDLMICKLCCRRGSSARQTDIQTDKTQEKEKVHKSPPPSSRTRSSRKTVRDKQQRMRTLDLTTSSANAPNPSGELLQLDELRHRYGGMVGEGPGSLSDMEDDSDWD